MKVWLGKDEKYPDLILQKTEYKWYSEVEIPDEIVKEYEESLERFNNAENKIFELWEKQGRVDKCK